MQDMTKELAASIFELSKPLLNSEAFLTLSKNCEHYQLFTLQGGRACWVPRCERGFIALKRLKACNVNDMHSSFRIRLKRGRSSVMSLILLYSVPRFVIH